MAEYAFMRKKISSFADTLENKSLRQMFLNCFYSTLDTTTEIIDDGTSYVFTGDIPAMWLRDSSVQVMGYLPYASDDSDVARLIKGLISRQMRYILIDPYANAFKKEKGAGGHRDSTDFESEWIWERKFEIDSLCYPLWLAKKYYYQTSDAGIFDGEFLRAYDRIIFTLLTEQHHDEKSPYFFVREGEYAGDTLENSGKGAKSKPCGLIWSAFRPSDDKCVYHYLIPANLMAASVFKSYAEIFTILNDKKRAAEAAEFSDTVLKAVKNFGIYNHPKYGKIYAYETDGYNNFNLMDDANVPSLLSLPYLGCCDKSDKLYLNTRRFILSCDNPYYFEGGTACGVGSPHTPKGYIWHIGIIIQMLTCTDAEEKERCFNYLVNTDADCGVMHESFDKDNPDKFTREWFAWANTLFALAVTDKFKNNEIS